jgi:rRNA-processing protein FCF1
VSRNLPAPKIRLRRLVEDLVHKTPALKRAVMKEIGKLSKTRDNKKKEEVAAGKAKVRFNFMAYFIYLYLFFAETH